jgi:uncharacterized membrane protein
VTRAVAAVAIALVALGVGLRFTNLDRKVFWNDETHTALWISGYDRDDFAREAAASGGLLPVSALARYRSANPEGSVRATVAYLAKNVPQHTPLYGVEARLFAERFGDSVAALRALPALQSLLGLALIFWLCRELFPSSRAVAWVAMGLLAVSPVHLLYAQEARPYAQWTVTTILASAALLRALREGTWPAWGLYALAAALGLYSFLLFALVLAGHAAYVVALEGPRPTRGLSRFAAAATAALAAFSPWLWVLATRADVAHRSTWHVRQGIEGAYGWAHRALPLVSTAFVDLGRHTRLSGLLVAALIAASLVALCRATPRRTWALVLALVLPIPLALGAADLALGGKRLLYARYNFPAYLGALLAVAWYLGRHLDDDALATAPDAAPPPSPRRRAAAAAGALALASAGAASCFVIVQAETWWNKYGSPGSMIAPVINREPAPLVATARLSSMVPLSYHLREDAVFYLLPEGAFTDAAGAPIARRGAAFLVKPHEAAAAWCRERGYRIAKLEGGTLHVEAPAAPAPEGPAPSSASEAAPAPADPGGG